MSEPALLIVDVQKGIDEGGPGARNNPEAEANIAALLAEWRKLGRPVVHVRHCSNEPDSPLRPERPGNAVKDEARPLPEETQFTKAVNSAFIGTGLEAHLRERGIDALVVAGFVTDHCVSTTVRMAANLGFDVTLVADATATFGREGHDGVFHPAEAVHRVNLASLNGEFCVVCSTGELLRRAAAMSIMPREDASS